MVPNMDGGLYCDLSPDHIYVIFRVISRFFTYFKFFYWMIVLKLLNIQILSVKIVS